MTSLLSVRLINSKAEYEDALELRSLSAHRGSPVTLEVGDIIRPYFQHTKRSGDTIHFLVNNTRIKGTALIRCGTFDKDDNEPLEIIGVKQVKSALVTYADDTKTIVVVMEGDRSDEAFTMPPNPSVNTHDTVEVIFDENGYTPHWADAVASRR